MFCSHCGNEVSDKADICIKCGCKIEKHEKASSNDGDSFLFGLLGFFVPVAGLILFLIWHDEFPKRSKSAGIGALVSVILGIVSSVVYLVIYLAFVIPLFSSLYSFIL